MQQKLPQPLKILPGFKILFCLGLLTGCTAGKWITVEEPVIDSTQGELLGLTYRHQAEQVPSPVDPVITFTLDEIRKTKYPVRLSRSRTFQKYQPSTITWTAGFLTAFSLYAIGKGWFGFPASPHPFLYTFPSAALAAGTGLQLRATGPLVPTGEQRVLYQVGEKVLVDTVRSRDRIPVKISIRHPAIGSVTLNQYWRLGRTSIDLAAVTDWPPLYKSSLGDVETIIETGGISDTIRIPVTSFMRGYAEINQQRTVLYIRPVAIPSASLAQVGKGSRFPINGEASNGWLPVMSGITPAFVDEKRTQQVWVMSPEVVKQQVVNESVPFGRIDIERDIPDTWKRKTSAKAFLAFRPAESEGRRKTNQERDVKVMAAYFQEYFGLESTAIRESVDSSITIRRELDSFRDTTRRPDPRIYVYLNGIFSTSPSGLILKNIAGRAEPLDSLFTSLARLNTKELILIMETGWDSATGGAGMDSLMNGFVNTLQSNGIKTAVFLAASPGESAWSYRDNRQTVDRLHGLFTYTFCSALRLNHHDSGTMRKYLETEIVYLSRRLRDKTQHPLFYGQNMSLLSPN